MDWHWPVLDLRPDIYGLAGILIAHVFFNMPLTVRLLLKAFEEIPQEQWKLGESLGFGASGRIRHILWPVMRQSLPGTCGLVFLLCAGSYTIILVLGGGPSTTTLQVAIQQALSFDFDPAKASLLTLAQLALAGLVLAVIPKGQSLFQTGGVSARRFHQAGRVKRLFQSWQLPQARCSFCRRCWRLAGQVSAPIMGVLSAHAFSGRQ